MRFGYRCLLAVLLAVSPAVAQVSGTVQMPLTVLDKHDRPATLDTSALRVLIDKNPAQVGNIVSPQNTPLDFIVAVDISRSTGPDDEAVKKATVALFQQLATGQNRGWLLLFDTKARESTHPLTADQVRLLLERVVPNGGTALYETLKLGCDALAHEMGDSPHRRAIVVITDGEDNQSNTTREEAVASALLRGIPIYALYGARTLSGMRLRGHRVLEEITEETGGQLFDSLNWNKDIAKMAEMITQQYLVTIAPGKLKRAHRHTLKFESGAKVLAPNTFVPATP